MTGLNFVSKLGVSEALPSTTQRRGRMTARCTRGCLGHSSTPCHGAVMDVGRVILRRHDDPGRVGGTFLRECPVRRPFVVDTAPRSRCPTASARVMS